MIRLGKCVFRLPRRGSLAALNPKTQLIKLHILRYEGANSAPFAAVEVFEIQEGTLDDIDAFDIRASRGCEVREERDHRIDV